MDTWNITPAELSAALDCPLSTIRAWHNRVGLLPREEKGGWRRYELEEALLVKTVQVLTNKGFTAERAVEAAHGLHDLAKAAAVYPGAGLWVGIGNKFEDDPDWFHRSGDTFKTKTLEFKKFDSTGFVMDALGWFDDSAVIVLDLGKICRELKICILDVRGLINHEPLSEADLEALRNIFGSRRTKSSLSESSHSQTNNGEDNDK